MVPVAVVLPVVEGGEFTPSLANEIRVPTNTSNTPIHIPLPALSSPPSAQLDTIIAEKRYVVAAYIEVRAPCEEAPVNCDLHVNIYAQNKTQNIKYKMMS